MSPTGSQGDVDLTEIQRRLIKGDESVQRISPMTLREMQQSESGSESRQRFQFRLSSRTLRLVRELNRAIALIETEEPSLSGVSLSDLGSAVSTFLKDAHVRYGLSGSSLSRSRPGEVAAASSTRRRSTKPSDQLAFEGLERRKSRIYDKRGKPHG